MAEISPEVSEFVAGLRELADLYEHHPQLPVPYHFPDNAAMSIYSCTLKKLRPLLPLLAPVSKEFYGDMCIVTRKFGPIELRFVLRRNEVCRLVSKGSRFVPEEVIERKVIPAHIEEVIEWECGPLLPGDTAVEVQP